MEIFLRQRTLGQKPAYEPARTEPATEGTAEQKENAKPCGPDSPEGMGNPSGTGQNGTVLTADKRHDERTSEDAVKSPFT